MKSFASIFCTSILLIPLVSLKSKADDLDAYWYGFGIGSTATLFGLQNMDVLTNEEVQEFMQGMRQTFAEETDRSIVNMPMFNSGVQMTRNDFPNCRI